MNNHNLYSASEIAGLIGVSSQTIKDWESAELIPISSRMGLRQMRVWPKWKAERILEFAKENGYPIYDIEAVLSKV